MIRFGAEDIERIEMILWFKELGPASMNVALGQDEAKAETEAQMRETMFEVFKDVMMECAANGRIEVTAYDPEPDSEPAHEGVA
ncbi:hypothetical protein SIDU_13715 [Sphingobium indicum B90A]|uniref:Uncharacterized protein n=2 Tax=Sphingobium indicum TaxID=332055 RepID=A0A1L5BRQ4_SPHIB|nr:hypothetical protein SIDU_13715 [Sphingobium indicum B90A]